MKRFLIVCLALFLCLSGCAQKQTQTTKHYTATFLTLFDTVTTIKGPAENEEAFREIAQDIHDDLQYYHRLFDIYNEYDGINNLKTINDNAGVAPVEVDTAIIELLTDCREYYELTGGKVNAAMGSVLQLWHDARDASTNDPSSAFLPDINALKDAAGHTGFDSIMIDTELSTVYISDPAVRLDVGAIAKGWATQRAADAAPKGVIISVGGNVCSTGPKYEDGTPWVIGIMDPNDNSKNVHTVYISSGSVVTSGDYQRTFSVDGVQYHHIIDPDTLMPSAYWRSVTIVCSDSALADALSTALFLLPLEDGKILLEKCGADALWIDTQGHEYMTEGFKQIIRT